MMGECFSKMGLDYPEKSFTYDLQSNNLVQDFLSEVIKFYEKNKKQYYYFLII